ncbi:hypothetical protein GCM10007989_05220 [Devosia pacifica]|uniref:ParB/Sulfiredoxin domain-containing protein n=1 Tax=Devosia pacifica TaxID=1335967 RepID=A0A918RYB4_9HYPH|nr:DUF6551 family protein [Devosia pacifica]GHA13580.1 hypothetical protein GCM10007989_05220 [Devosia pacifica]
MTETPAPLRQVRPIALTGLIPAAPTTGAPICEMVDPRDLWVDPAYQRSVGEKGLKQVRRIVEGFDWAKFKPPICAFAEDGQGQSVLKVLDGQHTAIACASNPHIETIPVMIVEAPDTQSQAVAFIGQNKERLNVTPLQIHFAALAAQDPEAITVAQVCDRAGLRILRSTPKVYAPRDTVAIAAINGLTSRRGAMRARQILEVLAKAELAPVTAPHIKSAEYLLTDPEFRETLYPEALTECIQAQEMTIDDEAKLWAATHRVPVWKAMASIWFRKCRKKRRPA